MLALFDVDFILFHILGYPMSLLELVATLSGGFAVWLSAKENVWSWIYGLVNVVLAFFLFYQIQLYPDMFLQVFFFVTNILGFIQWKYPKKQEENLKKELRISRLSQKQFTGLFLIGLLGTFLMGTFSANLHELVPSLFSLPSAFPYLDSFTTVMSIVATFMLIRKKVEAWYMWLLIDILATYMYFVKDVKLYSLLYALFVGIAAVGAYEWTRKYQKGI